MKTLSLKLDDAVFQETEKLLEVINKPRNRYINEALKYFNQVQKKKILETLLKNESMMVSDESMIVLAEFEKLDSYDH